MNKRTINLIVLIIIVVIVILPVVVILILNKNQMGIDEETQFKSDFVSMTKTAQVNLLTKSKTDDTIMSKEIVGLEVYEYVPELKGSKYRAYISKGQLAISADNGEYGGYSEEQIKWAQDIYILVKTPYDELNLKDITTSIAPPGGTLHTDPQPRPNSAPVPNGFVVSSLSTENTVDQGLVIKQGSDPASTTSNEFVWIPVPDISQMYDESTNRSKLYNFQDGRDATIVTGCLTISDGYREPDILMLYDTNSTYLQQAGLSSTATILDFQAELIASYNKMIESVKKYKGYYIARYEAGDLSKSVIVSKKNNADIGNQTWYTMYKKAKEMISNDYVQSSMIWDGQWDASLQWMNGYLDTGNSVIDSTGNGNVSGFIKPTGSNDDYKFKNIYDMTGNVLEWNLGAHGCSDRVLRVGSYYSTNPLSKRLSNSPYIINDDYGMRLALYVKL